jgi:hypothetical protein
MKKPPARRHEVPPYGPLESHVYGEAQAHAGPAPLPLARQDGAVAPTLTGFCRDNQVMRKIAPGLLDSIVDRSGK